MTGVTLTATSNAAAVAAALGRSAERVDQQLDRDMRRATIEARNALFQAMSAPKVPAGFWGYRSPAGPVLAARSGQTRNSITPGRVFRVGAVVVGSVGHPSRHVAALEVGATITARNAKNLAIPTGAALSGGGDLQGRFKGRSLRDVPGLFFLRSKTGRGWLAERTGKKSLRLLFLLKPSVKLPEKRIFRELARRFEPVMVRIFGAGASAAAEVR